MGSERTSCIRALRIERPPPLARGPGRRYNRGGVPRSSTVTSGLGRNAALALAGAGLEKLVPLGIALYLPRHLGVAGFGEYALVVAMLGFFQVLPDASLEAVLVARLARAEGEARAIAGRAAALRLLVAAGGALLGLAALALVTRDGRLVGAGGVAALGLAAGAGNPYRALLRARLR